MRVQRPLPLVVLGALLACHGTGPEDTAARIQQIGELRDATDEELRFVLERLELGDAEQRAVAAWTLGEVGRRSTVPGLLRAFREDPNSLVRLNACVALGKFDGEEVQRALVEGLDADDEQIRAAALRGLARPRFSGAAAAVGEVLENGPDALRPLALDALVAMGGPETRAVLERVAGDPQTELRSIAAFSLGKLRDPRALPVLAGMLDDESWEVRANAAQALGMIGEPSSRPLLEPLLQDGNEQVRLAARAALDRLD